MTEPVVVYDLLRGLEGEGLQQALNLITLAGQLGMANGYFFEKQSADKLNAISETEVFDAENNSMGTIPHPDHFWELVYLGQDSRFKSGHEYRMAEPKLPGAVLNQLFELRAQLLDNLRKRGTEASHEYALIGEMIGGSKMTASEIIETISRNLAAK